MHKYQRANNICSIWPLKALIWGHIPAILKKKCDSHLPSLMYCLFSKTNLTRSMGFLKKTKKQVVQSQHLLYMLLQLHSVHTCTPPSSLALSYLHGTPLFFLCGLSLCPSPILKFLCVCVCVCLHTSVQERVYLYVGHLVAIRVNHPSFLRLAVSHKLT